MNITKTYSFFIKIKKGGNIMNISNLINIKKYPAGKNGNLLVSLDENLVVNEKFSSKKGEREVKVMIATAYVRDKAVIAELEKKVDAITPANKVIVVNKKFTRLPNKLQLALLVDQNAKLDLDSDEVKSNIDRQVHGEMAAMQEVGIIATKLALDTARKTRERSEMWASRGRHSEYKKSQKALQSLGNTAQVFQGLLDAESSAPLNT